MTNREKAIIITNYLNEILNEAKCELLYSKPYELVIAVMLSSQTTDKKVNSVTRVLFSVYPTLFDLKNAKIEDVEEIIKPLGLSKIKSRNVISIAKALDELYDGQVPNNREKLMQLDGVGRKTSNVCLLELFNEPVMAVDTHVERVSKRLGIAKKDDSPFEVERKIYKYFLKEDLPHLHHQLIHFGRYYCKSQNPQCDQCKLKPLCSFCKNME